MCQFIKLVKDLWTVQDDTLCVNIGYQSVYQRILNSNLKLL